MIKIINDEKLIELTRLSADLAFSSWDDDDDMAALNAWDLWHKHLEDALRYRGIVGTIPLFGVKSDRADLIDYDTEEEYMMFSDDRVIVKNIITGIFKMVHIPRDVQ